MLSLASWQRLGKFKFAKKTKLKQLCRNLNLLYYNNRWSHMSNAYWATSNQYVMTKHLFFSWNKDTLPCKFWINFFFNYAGQQLFRHECWGTFKIFTYECPILFHIYFPLLARMLNIFVISIWIKYIEYVARLLLFILNALILKPAQMLKKF